MSQSSSNTIERGFHGYLVAKRPGKNETVDFEDIQKIAEYIEAKRSQNANELLLDVQGRIDKLYMAMTRRTQLRGGLEGYVFVLGWARQANPQALDTQSWTISYITLGDRYYLFEPTHFLIFRNYDGRVAAIQEFNYYGPRARRLCDYLAAFAKQALSKDDWLCHMRRIFSKDVARVLRSYSIVRGLRLELKTSAVKLLKARAEEPSTVSESIIKSIVLLCQDALNKVSPYKLILSLQSSRHGHLEMNVEDILTLFEELVNEIGEGLLSLKVRLKKGRFGQTDTIDLVKHYFVVRRRVRLARDPAGNVLRAVDTTSVINILHEVAEKATEIL